MLPKILIWVIKPHGMTTGYDFPLFDFWLPWIHVLVFDCLFFLVGISLGFWYVEGDIYVLLQILDLLKMCLHSFDSSFICSGNCTITNVNINLGITTTNSENGHTPFCMSVR